MTIYEYAKQELELVGYFKEPGGIDEMMANDVLELIKVFGEQDHSGSSAPFCVRLFERLASYKPIGPLTGEDSEWIEVGDNLWQNKRCSSVFKDESHAYRIDGRIFRDPDGSCWQNSESHVTINFPYEVGNPEIVNRK